MTGSVKNKAQVAAAGVLPETAKAHMHAALTDPDR